MGVDATGLAKVMLRGACAPLIEGEIVSSPHNFERIERHGERGSGATATE